MRHTGQPLGGGEVRHVDGLRKRPTALRGDQSRRLFGAGNVDVGSDHARAGSGKSLGKGTAKAARRPGDDDPLSAQFEPTHRLLRSDQMKHQGLPGRGQFLRRHLSAGLGFEQRKLTIEAIGILAGIELEPVAGRRRRP